MKSLFLQAAVDAGCQDTEAVEKVIEDAAAGQRPVVDDVIDSKLVEEEPFLEKLSGQLRLGWHPEVDPRGKRQLKQVCGPQLALKYRLLPLEIGDAPEDELDPAAPPPPPAPEGAEDAAAGEPEETPRLKLATYDPFNLFARQAAAQAIDLPIEWRMASRTRILQGIQRLYGVGADTFEQILAGREMDADQLDMKEESNIIDDDDDEASVVKFVNQIIREALQQRATDIHVEPLDNNLRIRYRIDGVLQEVAVPDNINALQQMVIARLKIMARLDIAERRLPQDGRIGLTLEDQNIDVRVATIPTVEGEQVSLRLLNQERFNIDRLGLLPRTRKTMDRLLGMSNGIILITGPTGSGKSTSLYGFLSELNKPGVRIVTVEDPVENKIEGVMQIAVKPEIGLTFAAGLRSILRADPNVVMVGEMRDLETVEIAIRAALTGHLVFSTLHTNDSIGGITRLIDMGVEPFLVSASVRAFLAQRLVRRLCPRCRQPADYHTPQYLTGIKFPVEKMAGQTIYQPKGCDACRGTGFHGRLAIYEVVLLTEELQDLIVRNAPYSELKDQALKDGFRNMREYGFDKVLAGETTVEEVVSATSVELGIQED